MEEDAVEEVKQFSTGSKEMKKEAETKVVTYKCSCGATK